MTALTQTELDRMWDEYIEAAIIDGEYGEDIDLGPLRAEIEAEVLAPYRPLIEAARAYRDAHAKFWSEGGRVHKLEQSETALLKAARTLEGHVEEGAG